MLTTQIDILTNNEEWVKLLVLEKSLQFQMVLGE